MSSFATAFWGGSDYAGGINTLFHKLQQGVRENQQVLVIARLRAEAEDTYGQSLGAIEAATNRIDAGFQRDDGASVKKAYDGICTEMGEASRSHKKIAANIRELVITPFSRWSDQHATRVQASQDDLQTRLKAYEKQSDSVTTYRSQYYNKCRRVEDLDEEKQLGFQGPGKESPVESKDHEANNVPTVKLSAPDLSDDEDPIDIGDETYSPDQIKKILSHALTHVKLGETKVPILGTYQNVSTGSDITDYILLHMNGSSVAYAERCGQDMMEHGFLRLVGSVGNVFTNSSRMHYQWRPKVFRITGQPGRRTSNSIAIPFADNPTVGAVTDLVAGWNPLNKDHQNENPSEKLRRDAKESDQRYRAAVDKLDSIRCNLEEAMMDHFRFMERCERDRLQAIKSVILDFSGAISNVIPSLQSTVDHMMLFQETVQPLSDLRYLLENYRTGNYVPRVPVYENYYNQVDDQIFGIEIEARARADRKRVPLIVTNLLTFLDHQYPDLEGDEARRGIWLVDVPLSATHHLRRAITNAKTASDSVLAAYEVPVVASVLKLYLLELPDSIVSSHLYEVIKTVYNTTAQDETETTRVKVIQSALGQLRIVNVATLDAILTHYTRLIELTSADETYIAALASSLALCILRPKQETALSSTEKFNVRLVRDLFAHKTEIFSELKRNLSSGNKTMIRDRAVSTDESQRRQHVEERQRAIAATKRAPSPARISVNPAVGAFGHRRDRSASAETRFPIATTPSSATASPIVAKHKNALDVPHSPLLTQTAQQHTQVPLNGDTTASNAEPAPESSTSLPSQNRSRTTSDVTPLTNNASNETESNDPPTSVANGPDAVSATPASSIPPSVDEQPVKRNSLTRAKVVRKTTGSLQRARAGNRDSIASNASSTAGSVIDGSNVNESAEKKGVELTDAPMDDE